MVRDYCSHAIKVRLIAYADLGLVPDLLLFCYTYRCIHIQFTTIQRKHEGVPNGVLPLTTIQS